jgi:hypothetical protein
MKAVHLAREMGWFGASIMPGVLSGILTLAMPLTAQIDETCTVSILNRTIQVKPDGTWVLPNIPANQGRIRARATCVA